MADKHLQALRRSGFKELYQKFLGEADLSEAEYQAVLSVAVILLNRSDPYLSELAFRIILIYASKTGDLRPLYSVSVNSGLAPLAKHLSSSSKDPHLHNVNFFIEFNDSVFELYRHKGVVYMQEQWDILRFFEDTLDRDCAISAPTSFGKSDLIIDYCNKRPNELICVVVPTKALIAQTTRRLTAELDRGRDIVTHPESMDPNSPNAICVFTQERLLRHLSRESPLVFQSLIIDEAHNLLSGDDRDLMLAQALIIQKRRNPRTVAKYFTPFLGDVGSIRTRALSGEILFKRAKKTVKSEVFHLLEGKGSPRHHIYDQYMNDFVSDDSPYPGDALQYVEDHLQAKNIVYLNSPVKVEQYSRIASSGKTLLPDASIIAATSAVREYVHKDYFLADCLERGICYHHGSMPDIIKLYVEHVYSEHASISRLVCTSTLLEGVNIPADAMFLLEVKKGTGNLSRSQFQNLIGRASRFREIFSDSFRTDRLIPSIHIVQNTLFMQSNANLRKFLSEKARVDVSDADDVTNVLMRDAETDEDSTELIEAETFLENVSPDPDAAERPKAKTDFGRACFLNNIREFDILRHEVNLEKALSKITIAETAEDFMRIIGNNFAPLVENERKYNDFKRLSNSEAQSFYAMLIDWRITNASFSFMIESHLSYWSSRGSDLVYVGKWGQERKEGEHSDRWINMMALTRAQKVNLAIVRIQDEQDYIETYLAKYVELLNAIGLVSPSLFNSIKYGTVDPLRIDLINSGISGHLAAIVAGRYSHHAERIRPGRYRVSKGILNEMSQNGENPISIFEASQAVR